MNERAVCKNDYSLSQELQCFFEFHLSSCISVDALCISPSLFAIILRKVPILFTIYKNVLETQTQHAQTVLDNASERIDLSTEYLSFTKMWRCAAPNTLCRDCDVKLIGKLLIMIK